MKLSEDQVNALLALGEENLPAWLIECASGGRCDPLVNIPGDYDSPLDFLLDCLYDLKDERISRVVGEAACKAFRTLFDKGGFSTDEARASNANVAVELTFLIESLPCSAETAEELCQYLLLLLANRSYCVLTTDEADLRARMLLALAAKLSAVRTVRPELAIWLRDDFSNPDYVVPAFSVALRLNLAYASEHLETAVSCLRGNGLPTKYLAFETAKVLARNEAAPEPALDALFRLGDETVAKEFRESLERLGATGLIEACDRFSRNSQAVVRYGERATRAQGFAPIIPERSLKLDDYLTGSLREHCNKPDRIGAELGELLAAIYPALKRSAQGGGTSFERQNVVLNPLRDIVRNLDNGLWDGKSILSDGKPPPEGFDTAARRLIAAHAVSACMRLVAPKKEKEAGGEDTMVFSQRIGQSKMPSQIDHISTLLPKQFGRRLRMSVSPFPEDRLIYLTLKAACQHSKQLDITHVDTPWGEPSVTQRDVSLINEWVDLPQIKEADASQDIYRHGGYYVFETETAPDTTEKRFQEAFKRGIEKYKLGEYHTMMEMLRKRYQIPQTNVTEAPDWTKDFESFVMGESQLYIGGSINARLLKTMWEHTGRISVLCGPSDFKEALGREPANRLAFGSDLLRKTPKSKQESLKQALVTLYREAANFLHKAASNARTDSTGWGMAIVRHCLFNLAPNESDDPLGIRWNFAVCEDDVIALILDDNDFALSKTGQQATQL